MISFYLACSVLTGFSIALPVFRTEYYIVALFFPFLQRRLRYAVTAFIQLFSVSRIYLMYSSVIGNALVYVDTASAVPPEPTVVSTVIHNSNVRIFMHMMNAMYPSFTSILTVLLLIFALSYVVISFTLVFGFNFLLWTAPMSTYIIYKEFGLFDIISKRAGNKILFPDSSPSKYTVLLRNFLTVIKAKTSKLASLYK